MKGLRVGSNNLITFMKTLFFVVKIFSILFIYLCLERYYPDEDRWAFVAPMSVCRSGHGVGVVNGCLYALGGHDGVSYRNKVEYLNPQVGEWTTVGPMGMSKAVAGVAVVKEY